MINDARVQEIADDLIGTAKSLHDVATQEEIDTPGFEEKLYQLCFECGCCGWWSSTEELNNDPGQEYDEMCDECKDD